MSYFAFLSEHGTTLLLGTVTTIKVLICSMILYVIISMIFGLMRLSKNLIIQGIATVYIEFFRGTSLLVQLFWAYYVLPFFGISLEAFTAGVVALGLNFGAYGAEIVRAGILAIDKGQREAAESIGLKPSKVMNLVILPQARRVIIPPLTSQYLNLTKNSSLAIAIGYMDLVATLGGISLNQTGREMETMLIVMLIYLSVSLSISAFMNWYNSKVKLVGR